MRSITVKLLLAFLVISMLSVILIVLSARWVTEREFRSFLFTQNRNSIISGLAEFYSKNGTWSGVGVLGPECFDSVPFLELLTSYGSPWGQMELTPDQTG